MSVSSQNSSIRKMPGLILKVSVRMVSIVFFFLVMSYCSTSKMNEDLLQKNKTGNMTRLDSLIAAGGLKAACTYSAFTKYQQYKANLHCHSRHSDGSQFCDATADWYYNHGYQVLSITDHDAYGDQDGGVKSSSFQNDKLVHDWNGDGITWDTAIYKSGVETYVRDYCMPAPAWVPRSWQLEKPGRFIIINGIEFSIDRPHTNAINFPAGGVYKPHEGWGFIDRCQANAGLVFINHQGSWNNRPERLYNHADLKRIDGLEVMNGFTCRDNRQGNNPDGAPGFAEGLWDGCLNAGLQLWGFANDDAHNTDTAHFAGPGSAWNMIWAKNLSRPAVMEALRAGAFYGSCGIIVDKMEVTADAITVSSSNATHIKVVADGGRTVMQVDASKATYTVSGDEKWIRIMLWNDKVCYTGNAKPKYTQRAWLQPIYIEHFLAESR